MTEELRPQTIHLTMSTDWRNDGWLDEQTQFNSPLLLMPGDKK